MDQGHGKRVCLRDVLLLEPLLADRFDGCAVRPAVRLFCLIHVIYFILDKRSPENEDVKEITNYDEKLSIPARNS